MFQALHLFGTALRLDCQVELEEETDTQSVPVRLHSFRHTRRKRQLLPKEVTGFLDKVVIPLPGENMKGMYNDSNCFYFLFMLIVNSNTNW